MTEDAFARRVTKLGSLADPVRRRLYRFVADQPGAVSRDQAAEGVEVARHTAKFHLDKLVDEGLLTTEFRRMSGRSGPGAGRPAKLYRRSRKEVVVSIPERRYDLAGQVLAEAAERALEGTPMEEALELAATDAAAAMVEAVAPRGEGIRAVAEVLDRLGYEPAGSGELELRNCPYGRLAADHTDLVCRVNQSFVSALVGGLGCAAGVSRRDGGPAKGGCCVGIAG